MNEVSRTGSSQTSPDVAIIGGGVIGCALAYDLTARGVQVAVFDRRELAREASEASAGIISAPTPRLGPKAELALLSYQRYPAMIEEVENASGISSGAARHGKVDLVTEANASDMRARVEWQLSNRIRSEWLDAAQLRAREPAVAEAFDGGVFTPDTFSLRLGQFTKALARAAQRRGATIHEHTAVTGIHVEGPRATELYTERGSLPVGGVVVAAGAWSRMFSSDLGFSIGVLPVRGQMIAIADAPIPIHSVIGGEGGYLVPRADGTVAVGATEESEAGFDARVSPAGLAWLSRLIERLAPSLNHGRLVESWAGLRPGSDDGNLIIGNAPGLENVWLATGHFRGGALLAPGTSMVLAEHIVSGRADARLAAFEPGRSIALST